MGSEEIGLSGECIDLFTTVEGSTKIAFYSRHNDREPGAFDCELAQLFILDTEDSDFDGLDNGD